MKPKPEVSQLPREALSGVMQAAFDRATSLRGDATFIQVMGHTPELMEWYGEFYQKVFYSGRVSVRIKELIRLRLSTVHGCAFCNRGNRLDAQASGLTNEQIEAIGDEHSTLWAADERAALTLASRIALTNPRGVLDAQLYQELKKSFDDAQIVELGITMGVLTGMAKFLFVYDLVEKEKYCEFGASL